jgi:hypothetical protein
MPLPRPACSSWPAGGTCQQLSPSSPHPPRAPPGASLGASVDAHSVLSMQVAGQDGAVQEVASAVRLGRLGLQRGRRPLASFVLTGPRGVGRTTLCKACRPSLPCCCAACGPAATLHVALLPRCMWHCCHVGSLYYGLWSLAIGLASSWQARQVQLHLRPHPVGDSLQRSSTHAHDCEPGVVAQ